MLQFYSTWFQKIEATFTICYNRFTNNETEMNRSNYLAKLDGLSKKLVTKTVLKLFFCEDI